MTADRARRGARLWPWLSAFGVLIGSIGLLQAEVQWDAVDQDLGSVTDPNVSEVTATYRFTNRGSESVRITAIDTSCGCTTASLDDVAEYAPGARGRVFVAFAFGARQGIQKKTIVVHMHGASSGDFVSSIGLKVAITPLYHLSKEALEWQGDAVQEQAVVLTILPGQQAKVLKVISENGDDTFHASVTEMVAGQEYRLAFAPTSQHDHGRNTAVVVTDSAIARLQRIRISLFQY